MATDLATKDNDQLLALNEKLMEERAQGGRPQAVVKAEQHAIQVELSLRTAQAAAEKTLDGLEPDVRAAVLAGLQKAGG